jgi:hypothetical protein
MVLELQKAQRKPFDVTYVQVTLGNYEDVAKWCDGRIEMVKTKMLGAEVEMPSIKLAGIAGKYSVAMIGFYIVELKGVFRVYKTAQFHSTFEKKGKVSFRNINDPDMHETAAEVDGEPLSDTEAPAQDTPRTLDIPEGENLRSTL